MAIFRKIHVTFWEDSFIGSLTPEKKYFYLYLLTNSKTTQCGIYEITVSKICLETGYNNETVLKLMDFFTKNKKIRYSKATCEIAIKNWPTYNDSSSPKVQACVSKELKRVKDKGLIEYLYSMDTVTQEEQEPEQVKEPEQEQSLVADATTVELPPDFIERRDKFKTSVSEIGGLLYTKRMIDEFFQYWSEPNRSKKPKMRFELEKTWELNRRLSTWAGRSRSYECHLTESQKTIAQKKHEFAKELEKYLDKYPRTMLNEFYAYWSQVESKPNPEKLRYHSEEFWELGQRLSQWSTRNTKTK